MAKNLGPEIPDVEPEDSALPHRPVPPGRRPEPTVVCDLDRAMRRQPPAEIRIFAVEFDRRVEAANAVQHIPPDREIPSVEHGADPERPVDEEMRRRRDQ